MAGRGRTSFQKKQKEMARKDKRDRKAERRAQRKLAPPLDDTLDNTDVDRAESQDEDSFAEAEVEPGNEAREI